MNIDPCLVPLALCVLGFVLYFRKLAECNRLRRELEDVRLNKID